MNIRQAALDDAARLAEMEVFNYRLYFYPIFQNDGFYFDELQVPGMIETYRRDPSLIDRTYVYDDGTVKGFVRINGREIEKLFVEPVLQNQSIGSELLRFAVDQKDARFLWALEKNERAISFYERHGFVRTGERKPEEDTTEDLVRLCRKEADGSLQ